MEEATFHICEELIIEVLSQLPLKTLARFKCVSKQWYYLITNTIKVIKIPKLLIMSRSTENDCYSFRSLDHKTREEKMCGPKEEHLLRGPNVIVHSSCNGLVLIQIQKDLFVWNPLTKFFTKELTNDRLIPLRYAGVEHKILADLCFDHATKEYKVVLVDYYSEMCWYDESFLVAACGANIWVKIEVPRFVNLVTKGPFFKGYRHWLSKGNHSNFIVYFDPSTNEFIEVEKPQPNSYTYVILGLGVLDGCLCISRRKYNASSVEFLAMKEYGNEDSWDIMFVISDVKYPSDYRMVPLFKTKEGEVLSHIYKDDEWSTIKSYDIHGNSFRDIFVQEDHFHFTIYEESSFLCHIDDGPWSCCHGRKN